MLLPAAVIFSASLTQKKGNSRSPMRYRQETKEREGAKIHFLRITAVLHPRNLLVVHRGLIYVNIQQKSVVVLIWEGYFLLFSESIYFWSDFGLKLMYLFQAWYQSNLIREKSQKRPLQDWVYTLIRKTWLIKRIMNSLFWNEIVFSESSDRHNTQDNSCKNTVSGCSGSLLQIYTLTHGRHF